MEKLGCTSACSPVAVVPCATVHHVADLSHADARLLDGPARRVERHFAQLVSDRHGAVALPAEIEQNGAVRADGVAAPVRREAVRRVEQLGR
jgi:hypothetical protein